MLLRLHITPVGCQVMTGTGRAWMSAGAMDVSMLHERMLMTGVLFCHAQCYDYTSCTVLWSKLAPQEDAHDRCVVLSVMHSAVTTLHALYCGQSLASRSSWI